MSHLAGVPSPPAPGRSIASRVVAIRVSRSPLRSRLVRRPRLPLADLLIGMSSCCIPDGAYTYRILTRTLRLPRSRSAACSSESLRPPARGVQKDTSLRAGETIQHAEQRKFARIENMRRAHAQESEMPEYSSNALVQSLAGEREGLHKPCRCHNLHRTHFNNSARS